MTPSTNRLAREKSPYLLQHQHNPVDWFPWGEEAFARARQTDRPIFLSIGYSTCHWCHVMERESFENPDIAALLNAHYVSIKVDREERPDIDKIYMTFVQATTGQGGWPLNVFLTPDLKPFYGGTYFPPGNHPSRPGFPQVLHQIHQLWSSRRNDLSESAEQIHQKLAAHAAAPPTANLPSPEALHHGAAAMKAEYDSDHGGFGGAPKFPRPCQPAFLLYYGRKHRDAEALRMVLHTCDQMAAGGVHDQLGGGFHRYAVDAQWLVPHFEKMLYDNAQLAQLYLDAWLVDRQPHRRETLRSILDYVLRDMTHPEGGFYSAEDADSEGHEGKFYCWTHAELAEWLGPAELQAAVRAYGITEHGNFVDHSHPNPLAGQNVLSLTDPNLPQELRPALETARAKMLEVRNRRVRPHRDDKILASWNGLMLGAFARAGIALPEPRYLATAERNLAFLQEKLWNPVSHSLHHRWRDGARDEVQLLEAYAFLLAGVLDLYQATLNPQHLSFAIDLADTMIRKFHDSEKGGFYQATPSQDVILRLKDDYDGAEPAGNSVAALALLQLAAITGRSDFRQAAEGTFQSLHSRLAQLPQAVPLLLLGLAWTLEEPCRIVIAGDIASPKAQSLLHAAHSVYHPHKVILGQDGPVDPFARSLPPSPRPLARVCRGTSCAAPTNDPEVVRQLLQA